MEAGKQPSFLRSLYQKKISLSSQHTVTPTGTVGTERTQSTMEVDDQDTMARKKNFERKMARIRWVPDPERFDEDQPGAQITHQSDLVPYWSDWVFDSNIIMPESGEETIPDSLGPQKEWEWKQRQKNLWRTRRAATPDDLDDGERELPILDY